MIKNGKRICDKCGESQFGTHRVACVSCGFVFPTLPKEEPTETKENQTVITEKESEFSCIKCRKLWVGVFIAGLVTLAIFNFFMNFIDFGISVLYDIIKTGVGLALVIGLGIGTWFCMHEYCVEDKGNMIALTVGLVLAIFTILILTYTVISISATATWFEFEESKDVNVLLNANCEVFIMLHDYRYSFEYYDEYYEFSGADDKLLINEKREECYN